MCQQIKRGDYIYFEFYILMGKKRILIIEDNADIRENTAEILEFSGYDTLTAADGKEGVAIAMAQHPDLILCDIMMPELDGFGVLYLLNNHPRTKQTPFIFITAKTERVDVRKGMDLGADDYLTKPFDDIELLKTVEARLKKSSENKVNDESALNLMNELISQARVRSYKAKQNIYQENDDVSYIYYVISGKVKLFVSNHDGREIVTNVCSENEFFGYESLLLNTAHNNNAESLETGEIGLIRKEVFLELLNKYPNLSTTFLNLLSNSISQKDKQLLNLAYNSVRKRIALVLISFAEKFGIVNDQSKFRISREDLANAVGTANETISRNLSDFIEEGLIEKTGSTISILSIKKLKEIKQ